MSISKKQVRLKVRSRGDTYIRSAPQAAEDAYTDRRLGRDKTAGLALTFMILIRNLRRFRSCDTDPDTGHVLPVERRTAERHDPLNKDCRNFAKYAVLYEADEPWRSESQYGIRHFRFLL